MPAGFYFPDKQTEFWTPATTYWRFARESVELFPDWARRWTAVARLAPGVSLAEARGDLTRVGRQLSASFPSNDPAFPGFGTTVVRLLDTLASADVQLTLWVLLGAVGLVLLVACANVASLLLARGATRQSEFAVRLALGAGRGRLVRQLIIEHMVLGFLGGAVGTVIAGWSTRLIGLAISGSLPRADEVGVDARVLGFAVLLSLAAGLLSGMAPALRLSGGDAGETLRGAEGGRSIGGVRLHRSRRVLVAAECALAIVLLVGAGLLVQSLRRLNAVDAGFDPRGVLALRLEFPSESPPSAEERAEGGQQLETGRARVRLQRMEALLARVTSTKGVESAGFIDDLFITGVGRRSITIPGRDATVDGQLNDAVVTPGFFGVLRVPLRRGRYLTSDDTRQKIRALWTPVANNLSLVDKERLAVAEPVMVNEAFVARFFPGEDPIGKRFCIDPINKTYWYTIVGVMGDMHRQGLDRDRIPEYFGPYLPSPNGRGDLLVRVAHGDPMALVATLRSLVSAELPVATIAAVSTAESQLDGFSAQRRLQTWLLTTFALLALLLAAVGIFGLVHYGVAERTREIGVRVALGATPGRVLGMMVGQGMRMPTLGIAIGLAASLGLTRLVSHLLFGVTPTDLATFAAVAGVLSVAALAACYLAARKAAHLDPVQALRG
jgi:putative ABC transport system permease protein